MVRRRKSDAAASKSAVDQRAPDQHEGQPSASHGLCEGGAALRALIDPDDEMNVEKLGARVALLDAEMRSYPSLPDGSSDALSEFLAANDVPFYEGRSIRGVVAELAQFEDDIQRQVRTTRVRISALESVEKHAYALLGLLGDMPIRNERTHLEYSLRAIGWSAKSGWQSDGSDLFDEGDPRRVKAAMAVLGALVDGARHARGSVNADGTAGGRPDVVSERAKFVWRLAACAQSLGHKLGRGGKFAALCRAAFAVAKVHVEPEGAIRYAVEHYGAPGVLRDEGAAGPKSGLVSGGN